MEASEAELLKNFTVMTRRFEQLSHQLTEVAEQASMAGALPSDTLIDHIAISRRSLTELREQALELVCLLAAPTVTTPDIASIKDVESILEYMAAAHRKKTQEEQDRIRGFTVLDRILSLIHRDQADCPPLEAAQAKAKTLRDQLRAHNGTDLHPDLKLLAQGRHPLAELLTLAEGYADLDDDLWLLLKHAVAEHFGKPLALSAARGKLSPGRLPDNQSGRHG